MCYDVLTELFLNMFKHDDPNHSRSRALRAQILDLVSEYASLKYAPIAFVPGETPIPPSGKLLKTSFALLLMLL